jgi:predicted nucleic-acid-binding Zn-ribbon protein
MKRTLQCPKCDSRKLWHIEKLLERGNVGWDGKAVPPLALALTRGGWTGYKAKGTIEMFACAKCGFAELYADTTDLLDDAKLGVHLIDNEPSTDRL